MNVNRTTNYSLCKFINVFVHLRDLRVLCG